MDELQTAPGQTFPALPRLSIISVALLLVAGVLGSVALAVSWVDFDGSFSAPGGFGFGGGEFQFEGSFTAFTLEMGNEEAKYTDRDLDDTDGVGMMRAAGPLLVVGVSLAFVALILVVLDLFVSQRHLDLAAGITGALGFLTSLAGTILLPLGIAAAVQDFFGGTANASFVAGMFLAAVASLLALGGTVMAFLHALRSRAVAGTVA